jgi:hypothetical protein
VAALERGPKIEHSRTDSFGNEIYKKEIIRVRPSTFGYENYQYLYIFINDDLKRTEDILNRFMNHMSSSKWSLSRNWFTCINDGMSHTVENEIEKKWLLENFYEKVWPYRSPFEIEEKKFLNDREFEGFSDPDFEIEGLDEEDLELADATNLNKFMYLIIYFNCSIILFVIFRRLFPNYYQK